MANNKIDLDLNKELELLEEELNENNKIFNQVKGHYDKMMNSNSTGTLKFITDQTSNVMNIRNNRITIIKEMINVKKLKADMAMKERALEKDSIGDDGGVTKIAKELYDMMKVDAREGNIVNILNKVNDSNNADSNVNPLNNEQDHDKLLEERMRLIAEKKREENKESTIKDKGYVFVCDIEGNIYAVDSEGNDLSDQVEIPDFQIDFTTDELTGLITARNQFGDIIDIVEVA